MVIFAIQAIKQKPEEYNAMYDTLKKTKRHPALLVSFRIDSSVIS